MVTLMKIRSLILLVPLMAAPAAWGAPAGTPLAAGDWTVDVGTSKAGFVATGSPGFLRITGEGGKVSGLSTVSQDGTRVSGDFAVDLTALVTGISLRDKHMKEKYLETQFHPKALLKLSDVAIPAIGESPGEVSFKGDLTLKGVTRPVSGRGSLRRVDGKLLVAAEFPVTISEYPIGVPSWLGVTVAETVHISVEFTASHASSTARRE